MQTREAKNITNHLGKVLTVITDEKRMVLNGSNYSHYESVVVSVTDYSPFGVSLTGRTFTTTEGYRYGFNGKEEDKEGMGGGKQTYDYGFRIYNPALAKFLSVDPLSKDYPWYTPYQFAGNMPIWAVDVDGLEPSLSQEEINNPIGMTTISIGNGVDAIYAQGYYVIAYHYPGGDPSHGVYYYNEIGSGKWVQFHPMSMQDLHYQNIRERFSMISQGLDIMLQGAAIAGGSLLTLGAALEIYGSYAVATWLAEETVETISESVTGIPLITDPLDVIEKAVKGGVYKGLTKGLKQQEKKRIAEYLESPDVKSVERLKETGQVGGTPDFEIDGKKIEMRSLTSEVYNSSTALTALQNACKPGTDIIDLDIRTPGGNLSDARDLYTRFKNSPDGKKFTGEVRIVTSQGMVSFKK